MTSIQFTVYGKAQPAGSKTGFPIKRKNGSLGVAMSDSNPKAKSWQQEVKSAAAKAHDGPLLTGPASRSPSTVICSVQAQPSRVNQRATLLRPSDLLAARCIASGTRGPGARFAGVSKN